MSADTTINTVRPALTVDTGNASTLAPPTLEARASPSPLDSPDLLTPFSAQDRSKGPSETERTLFGDKPARFRGGWTKSLSNLRDSGNARDHSSPGMCNRVIVMTQFLTTYRHQLLCQIQPSLPLLKPTDHLPRRLLQQPLLRLLLGDSAHSF